MDAPETSSEPSRTPRSRRFGRELVVVGLGLALGLGVALGPRLLDRANASSTAQTEGTAPSGAVPLASLSTRQVKAATASAGAAIAKPEAPDPPAPPAVSARAAVEAFLTAEAAGQPDVSYGFLSAADRTRVGGRVSWVADHPNLPPITGFSIDSAIETGDQATVVTSTDLRASLDEVVGLVPAHARATWTAVREDGGWRVAYASSRLSPEYPPDSLAVDAAREWVAARQSCRHAAEWSGGVLGPESIVAHLCRAPGAVTVGAPGDLVDDSDGSLTAEFGPDVYAWARVVPVTGPRRLDLVLAPVGERWLVVGAREASPGTR